MGKRSFSELSVVATGVQSFESRFGKRRRHEYDDLPPISQWRCNLTALSQESNLYFVAYGQEIYVYVPRYPTQSVPKKPTLIVPSQPSSPGLRGYLDPRNPHTINNLIVQRLGNDEVIATVRDDGDVEAVLVRHIAHAIERRAEPESTIGVLADEVKPIFQDNVGISAWGLAIHSQARILATSSNNHDVHVFKFGLLSDEGDPSDDEPDELPDAADVEDAAAHRRLDVTQRVLNGNANIPYIAFCNTGDDPDARWLLTTDIGGFCRAIDLHGSSDAEPTTQQFRFGRSWFGRGADFDRLNAGWAIMFLDLRSFQREDDLNTALGLRESGQLPGMKGNYEIWDLSDTVEHVPENSSAFTYNTARKRQERSRAQRADSRQRQGRGAVPSDRENVAPAVRSAEEEASAEINGEMESEDGGVNLFQDDDDESDVSGNSAEEDEAEEDAELTSEALAAETDLIGDDEDFEDEGTEDSISFSSIYNGKRIFGNKVSFSNPSAPLCQDLPCPILHAAVKNVYLLQPSDPRYGNGAFVAPMVGLANPLRQAVSTQFGYLNIFDRLNMNAYIPSLGIVVLASQKGRALVLGLTRVPPGSAPSMQHKTHYAMRVECILPFAEQEHQNQRPFAPLHGIAVGPIQGTERAPVHHKRWRLMLMYQDHSVFSYEVGRPKGRDSMLDIESVVV